MARVEGGSAMVIPSDPYHSISEGDPDVHHVFADCPNGEQILPANCAVGDNGWPLCGTCKNMED
jgi:hypothetical protein